MADKPDMLLYWGSGSGPCWRVLFVLAEKGFWKDGKAQEGLKDKLIEFSKKEHKADDVTKLNPRGQVPTFKDGDTVINESTAICLYLEEKYGGRGTPLLPSDVTKKALVYQRLFELSNLEGAIRPVFMYVMKTKDGGRDEEELKKLLDTGRAELERWNAYLDGKDYLCGEFGLADVYLYVMTATAQRQGANLDKFPALKKFHEKVGKRQAAVDTTPPHWKDTPSPGVLKGLTD